MSAPWIFPLADFTPSARRAGSGGAPSGTFAFVSYMGVVEAPLAQALAAEPDAAFPTCRRPQSTA